MLKSRQVEVILVCCFEHMEESLINLWYLVACWAEFLTRSLGLGHPVMWSCSALLFVRCRCWLISV